MLLIKHCLGDETFYLQFQPKSKGAFDQSTTEWMEFVGDIPESKEITNCQWIKTRYFNMDISFQLWSYCTLITKDTPKDEMDCFQVYLQADWNSGGRDVRMGVEIVGPQRNTVTREATLRNFLHRTWVFLCFSASSITRDTNFYYNGKHMGIEKEMVEQNKNIFNGSQEMYDYAFIFGQEPDQLRGSFEKDQSFLGDLSELNLWSYLLDASVIKSLSTCKEWKKGDIIAWQKENIKNINVLSQDLKDASTFCKDTRQLLIFPKMLSFLQAKKTCIAHGGVLVVPKSKEENNLMKKIVYDFKKQCIRSGDSGKINMAWIGAKKNRYKWYEIDDNRNAELNFTYFRDDSGSAPNGTCAIMDNIGGWHDAGILCDRETLCTVCSISGTPVFTIKGVCYHSAIDWNYYMMFDEYHKIQYFDGSKETKILPIEGNGAWKSDTKRRVIPNYEFKSLENETYSVSPIGRKNWSLKDTTCNQDMHTASLAISSCDFKTKFTCNTGTCVQRNQRCDGNEDCDDGSDEKLCYLVEIPDSYRKENPPSFVDAFNESFPLYITSRVISIDLIDTVNMVIAVTLEIGFRWNDKRLQFFNLLKGYSNLISPQISNELWLPLNSLIIENSVVGEVVYDKNMNVFAYPEIPEPYLPYQSYETVIYNGSQNLLGLFQTMKIKYNCEFKVYKFPFDNQRCDLRFKMYQYRHIKFIFVERKPLEYGGPATVDQFYIDAMTTKIFNNQNLSKTSYSWSQYVLVIEFHRLALSQLLKTFIPTFLLCLLAFSTTLVDMERPGDRFMGAATMILVLATWINIINGELPKTSYVKLIDFWFVWHISVTFAVILYHILVDKIRKQSLPTNIIKIKPLDEGTNNPAMEDVDCNDRMSNINKLFMVVFGILDILFYVIYFSLSLL